MFDSFAELSLGRVISREVDPQRGTDDQRTGFFLTNAPVGQNLRPLPGNAALAPYARREVLRPLERGSGPRGRIYLHFTRSQGSQLAVALAKLGRTAEAEVAVGEAKAVRELKANASASTILLLKAKGLRSQGDLRGAIANLRQAVKTSPDFAEANFQLATLLSQKPEGRAEAEKLLRHVLEIAPAQARAYAALGTLLVESKRQTQGVKLLRECLRRAPSLADAHIQLGKHLLEQKRPAEAAVEFDAALAWEPDNVAAKKLR